MKPNDIDSSSTKTHTADTRNPEWESYAPKGEGRTDEQIRADIHQALLKLENASGKSLSIEVKDGVVTLGGRVEDEAEHKQVQQLIRSIHSVRELRDELQLG